MAYGSAGYYPANYSPFYPVQASPQMPQQNQQASGNGPTWIQGGESTAKAWYVPPGGTVDLWDSEENVIYLKTVDLSGKPTLKYIDYVVRDQQNPQNAEQAKVDYATREELAALSRSIKDLRDEVDGLSIRRPKKKEDNTD